MLSENGHCTLQSLDFRVRKMCIWVLVKSLLSFVTLVKSVSDPCILTCRMGLWCPSHKAIVGIIHQSVSRDSELRADAKQCCFLPFSSAQMDKLVPVLCSNQDGHCEPGLFRIRSQEALMIESQAQDRHS
jgi:hypothetical protein